MLARKEEASFGVQGSPFDSYESSESKKSTSDDFSSFRSLQNRIHWRSRKGSWYFTRLFDYFC